MIVADLRVAPDDAVFLDVTGDIRGKTVDYAPRATQANTSQTLGMHHAKIAAQATMVRG